ncbi:MAG: nicotinate-nucleotide--dimethylbenzimidazole phosphoribosyltransferase [Ferruginibacter sp.]|uniref:nicotinate-nucleotide--dimethylbenzimidazole phosphoribosyltransferase n=1 Tax=Ferruginibacter sp. TaxID=1940288 RepID=UPI00265AF9B2|nr:nicotinate-nucleotide--dimethylbenzimidazole phosphoribosyltransferase [Ferruginibacter sp.]MDB5280652.1 nicotinate-nucleotide--dimethylbenzimidazole phosphoribosyltransferase [Ferruginibacter sp.]
MQLQEVIDKRRDTRHFLSDEEVPAHVLQAALEAAHKAPSVGLTEAARFYIIRKKELRQQIYELFVKKQQDNFTEIDDNEKLNKYKQLKLEGILEAPIGLIMTTDFSVLKDFAIGVTGTASTLEWSSVCALQNLWLSLTENGYSLGWVSIMDYNGLSGLLNLPSHEKALGYFCIGKPATDYNNQPMLQQQNWKQKNSGPAIKEIAAFYPLPAMPIEIDKDETASIPITDLKDAIQFAIDNKTKPRGSLGLLEQVAFRVAEVQNTISPVINNPHIIVFAADHGIAKTGLVNPYPQEVTAQMVTNFLNGGAAINVFCNQNNIKIKIVDAGVCTYWQNNDRYKDLINAKVGYGTKNYMEEDAMTDREAIYAIEKGKEILLQVVATGCNSIGFGEMGIGNTSSAALIMSCVLKVPITECTGKGTGASSEQLKTKTAILEKVFQLHQLHTLSDNPIGLLQKIGGFEIAMMTGAYLEAAKRKMIIVVDGFIATAALLIAHKMNDAVLSNCIFAHTSGEQGHEKMLHYLQAKPLLQLGMRLGEGTGAAIAIPLIRSAVNFLNEMASFETAGVTNKV